MGRKAYTPEQKQIAKINRNTWRRALYAANKIIKAGASYRIDIFGMKEFKQRFNDFKARTNLANSGNLEDDLDVFLKNEVNKKTPKQAISARDNFLDHLKTAIEELNKVGDPKKASERTQQYYNVMLQAGVIKTKVLEYGIDGKATKKEFTLLDDKLPGYQDFMLANDKYLRLKRTIQIFFPGKEYYEAYGSGYETN